jgi:uncharacterized protein (UPF0335 family)
MEKKSVDLLELSDSQKTEFLKHVSAYLKQRVEEERYYKSMLSSLGKDDMGLEFNLTIEGQYLKNTIEKIENLEAEKKSLLLEIEELKKTADTKATALESEVKALRDEVKSLKILMHESEPSVKPAFQKIKKAMQNI